MPQPCLSAVYHPWRQLGDLLRFDSFVQRYLVTDWQPKIRLSQDARPSPPRRLRIRPEADATFLFPMLFVLAKIPEQV